MLRALLLVAVLLAPFAAAEHATTRILPFDRADARSELQLEPGQRDAAVHAAQGPVDLTRYAGRADGADLVVAIEVADLAGDLFTVAEAPLGEYALFDGEAGDLRFGIQLWEDGRRSAWAALWHPRAPDDPLPVQLTVDEGASRVTLRVLGAVSLFEEHGALFSGGELYARAGACRENFDCRASADGVVAYRDELTPTMDVWSEGSCAVPVDPLVARCAGPAGEPALTRPAL